LARARSELNPGILGVSSILATPRLSVPASIVDFDLPVMIAVAVSCLPLFSPGVN